MSARVESIGKNDHLEPVLVSEPGRLDGRLDRALVGPLVGELDDVPGGRHLHHDAVDPRLERELDVGDHATGEGEDPRGEPGRGDPLHRLEVGRRDGREPGLDAVDAGLGERLGDPHLLVGGEDDAGLLLAVAEGDIVHRHPRGRRHVLPDLVLVVPWADEVVVCLPRLIGHLGLPAIGGFSSQSQSLHSITRPPVTSSVTPVSHDAASESRKTVAFAVSSGSPSRPSGDIRAVRSIASGRHHALDPLGHRRARRHAVRRGCRARRPRCARWRVNMIDAGLRGRVRGLRQLVEEAGGDRGHRHDRAPAPLDHAGQERPHRDERRGQVRLQHLAPLLDRHLRDRRERLEAAGERHQQVDRAEPVLDRAPGLVDLLGRAAVGGQRDRLGAVRPQLGRKLLGGLEAARDDRHLDAVPREQAAGRGADPLRAAADERRLPGEIRVDRRPAVALAAISRRSRARPRSPASEAARPGAPARPRRPRVAAARPAPRPSRTPCEA